MEADELNKLRHDYFYADVTLNSLRPRQESNAGLLSGGSGSPGPVDGPGMQAPSAGVSAGPRLGRCGSRGPRQGDGGQATANRNTAPGPGNAL